MGGTGDEIKSQIHITKTKAHSFKDKNYFNRGKNILDLRNC